MIKWYGDDIRRKILQAADGALNDGAEHIAKDWMETIPYSTGDLASHVHPEKTGELRYEISSSGPYAARQEFDESLRHPNPKDPRSRSGRKAHAGRDALDSNKERLQKLLESRISAALR